jgi:hypothetical protein
MIYNILRNIISIYEKEIRYHMQFCLPILHFKESHIIEKLQAKYALSKVKNIFLFSVVSTPSCLTNPLFLLWKMKPSIQPPQAAYNQKAKTLEQQPLQIPLGGYFEI